MSTLRILAVGRKLTEDLLIWQRLGRALSAAGSERTMIVHGMGETAERILEGEGYFSVAEAPDAAVERAVRTESRRIVATLTDQGVPAVGFLGFDFGFLARQPDGSTDARIKRLVASSQTGAVPVLATVAKAGHRLEPMGVTEALQAIVRAQNRSKMRIDWLVDARFPQKPDPFGVAKKTGEMPLSEASDLRGVSIHVLGISEVSSGDPNAGFRLS